MDKSNEAALRALLERPPAVKPRAPAKPATAPAAAAGGTGARSPAVAAPAAAGGWLGGLFAPAPAPTPAIDATALARERGLLAATLAAAQAEVAKLRGEAATRDATIAARDRALATTSEERDAARKNVGDRDVIIAGLRRELDAAAATIAVRDRTIAAGYAERDRLAATLMASNSERDGLASSLATALAACNTEREAARKSMADRDATIAGHVASIAARDATIASLRRELDAAATAAAPLRDAVDRLTAANELMHAVLHPPLEAAVQAAYLRGEDVEIVRDAAHDRVRLGGGAQGDVYAATLQCVAKVPKPPKGAAVHSDATVAAFWQEVAFHQPLCHPHIVAVHGGTIVADAATGRAKELRMVMERCGGGTLEGRLHGGEGGAGAAPGTLRQRLTWAAQVMSALVYLHARDIIHADLKPENVLLEDESPGARAKLSDFGHSVKRRDGSATRDSLLGFRGSLAYVDCRVLAGGAGGAGGAGDSGSIRKASDVYSAGVMLWELATVRRPYDKLVYPPEAMAAADLQLAHFVRHVREGGRPGTPEQLAALAPAGIGALIGRMWAARAEDRPTIAAAGEELARLAAGLAGDA
jgi:hypothetical protein